MKAEIIAVGTELLLGQVVNTNATFLSKELSGLGFEVYYHTVVGDNPKRLEETLALADARSELIILCGGLGPTDDDLTRDIVAKHVGESLIVDEDTLKGIQMYIERGEKKMSENNRRQAYTIEHGTIIPNPTGLAIGTYYENNKNSYLLLPGPPNELIPMFRQEIIPLLKRILPQKELLNSRVLRFYGIGESQLVTELADLITNQTNPTIAPYAKPNEVTIRITAKAETDESARLMITEVEKDILSRVGEYFYGYGEENSLVKETVKLLKSNKKTVTSAESLTAGAFQSVLGSVKGVSEVYAGGLVTYSNKSKEQLLGVPSHVIEEYGVVSKECAIAMAKHARSLLDTDYAVSFTGVAGPDILENKEVGTVWIGLVCRDGREQAKLYHFTKDRNSIREAAVKAGLNLLRQQVLQDSEK